MRITAAAYKERRTSNAIAMTKNASNALRLGIDLASKSEEELFKWFLACLLFGKPIQTEIAERAWRALIDAHLTSPTAVSRAGWDKLVSLLDRAHYVRYDFSTATKLLEVCQELKRRYGTLTNLLADGRRRPNSPADCRSLSISGL